MIRVAIVGTGNIANAHIQAYLQFPERCHIAYLVDIVPEKARRMREKYGLDAEVFDDHQALLPRPGGCVHPALCPRADQHQLPALREKRGVREAHGRLPGGMRPDAPRPG